MLRLIPLASFLAFTACSGPVDPPSTKQAGGAAHRSKGSHAEWGYAGDNGPERWADLGENYRVCAQGREESPINLHDFIPAEFGPLRFAYRPVPASIVNNGHTVQIDLPAGQTLRVHSHRYELLQVHIHHPSEHLLNGRRFPLEFHLVHRGADGELGVVAVFGEIGAAGAALEPLFAAMPEQTGIRHELAGTFNPASLLPISRRYLTYEGSLTTPPCTENVDWFVLDRPVAVTAAQVDRFGRLYPANARPVQRQFRRFVLRSEG